MQLKRHCIEANVKPDKARKISNLLCLGQTSWTKIILNALLIQAKPGKADDIFMHSAAACSRPTFAQNLQLKLFLLFHTNQTAFRNLTNAQKCMVKDLFILRLHYLKINIKILTFYWIFLVNIWFYYIFKSHSISFKVQRFVQKGIWSKCQSDRFGQSSSSWSFLGLQSPQVSSSATAGEAAGHGHAPEKAAADPGSWPGTCLHSGLFLHSFEKKRKRFKLFYMKLYGIYGNYKRHQKRLIIIIDFPLQLHLLNLKVYFFICTSYSWKSEFYQMVKFGQKKYGVLGICQTRAIPRRLFFVIYLNKYEKTPHEISWVWRGFRCLRFSNAPAALRLNLVKNDVLQRVTEAAVNSCSDPSIHFYIYQYLKERTPPPNFFTLIIAGLNVGTIFKAKSSKCFVFWKLASSSQFLPLIKTAGRSAVMSWVIPRACQGSMDPLGNTILLDLIL